MQVAVGGDSMASHVCTLVNTLVGRCKLQVMPTASASEVFALIDAG